MKKLLPLIILVLIFGALIAGYAALSKNKGGVSDTTTAAVTTTISLVDANASDIISISYTNDGETLSFTLENGTWKSADNPKMTVDQTILDDMAATVASIRAIRKISGDRQNAADYGLDSPSLTVTVKHSNGSTAVYTVGDSSPVGNTEYFGMSGDDAIYTISSDFRGSFDFAEKDIALLDQMAHIEKGEISSLSITTPAGTRTLGIKENSASEAEATVWILTNESGTQTELDNSVSDKLLTGIISLDLSDCVSYGAEESELAAYGLDKPYIITINYSRQKSVSGAVTGTSQGSVKVDYTYNVNIGFADSEKTFARLQDSDMVFSLDVSDIKMLLVD